ncbi:MAG TPA: HU family DNA-binding protein [Bryobacteraceae bacterium]|nr:HU family DNA-binding protein [Bryobacteraceae bacterium]
MKKEQVTRRLAKETHIPTAAAADQVDRIVSELLAKVRRGQSVSLPGLGTFQGGTQKEFQFEPETPGHQERSVPGKGQE